MNATVLLLTELLVGIATSLAALHVISHPLGQVLCRVCPDEQAALFWQSYTKVMLLIAPQLLILLVGLLTHFSDPLDTLRLTLIATLSGLLVGLSAVGKRLGRFIVVPPTPGKQP